MHRSAVDTTFLPRTIALLERTPQALHALLDGLPAQWTEGTDTPDGWRARDVVGHLITGELTDWMPRAEIILDSGTTRPFERFDRFAHAERDRDASLTELIDRFGEVRAASLAALRERVTDADLDRRGTHPTLGEVTLRQLLATWAVHDLDHSAQLLAALAGSQDEEVGPWKVYLGILLRREDPSAQPG